jgi:hypothetical protein
MKLEGSFKIYVFVICLLSFLNYSIDLVFFEDENNGFEKVEICNSQECVDNETEYYLKNYIISFLTKSKPLNKSDIENHHGFHNPAYFGLFSRSHPPVRFYTVEYLLIIFIFD